MKIAIRKIISFIQNGIFTAQNFSNISIRTNGARVLPKYSILIAKEATSTVSATEVRNLPRQISQTRIENSAIILSIFLFFKKIPPIRNDAAANAKKYNTI